MHLNYLNFDEDNNDDRFNYHDINNQQLNCQKYKQQFGLSLSQQAYGDSSQCQFHDQSEDKYHKRILPTQDPNIYPRTVQFIEVSSQKRQKYMQAKKGQNQQTNDLTINVCSLVKSFFNEYMTFQLVTSNQGQRISDFKQSHCNLESLRKLLTSTEEKEGQVDIIQYNGEFSICKDKLNNFIAGKIEDPRTLTSILKKSKMKFASKIILIKYLESVREMVKNPSQFKSWKNYKI